MKLLQHKFEESIPYLNEAAKRHRAFDIYRNLTIAYAQHGRHEEAVKAMNEGYAIDKSTVKDRESMHAAAVSYIFLGELHVADGFLKMLIQADPQGLRVKKVRGREKIRQRSSAPSPTISVFLMPHPVRAPS